MLYNNIFASRHVKGSHSVIVSFCSGPPAPPGYDDRHHLPTVPPKESESASLAIPDQRPWNARGQRPPRRTRNESRRWRRIRPGYVDEAAIAAAIGTGSSRHEGSLRGQRGRGPRGWQGELLQELVGRQLGEGVVHDGLDEDGDLLPDLRLDLVDDQLAVLVDEVVDRRGHGGGASVEEVVELDVGALDVEVNVGPLDAELLVARRADGFDGGRALARHPAQGGLEWPVAGDLEDEDVAVDAVVPPDLDLRHPQADEERPLLEVRWNPLGNEGRKVADNNLQNNNKNCLIYWLTWIFERPWIISISLLIPWISRKKKFYEQGNAASNSH